MPSGPGGTDPRPVRLRLMVVGLSISLWATAVFVRLVHLQVFACESLQQQAVRQSERTIHLDPRRGRILDRTGRELAVSVDVESIYADPQLIDDPEATAADLARVLQLDSERRQRLEQRFDSGRAFAWIMRKVDPVTARAVRELDLDGVDFLTETRRYYPRRELASARPRLRRNRQQGHERDRVRLRRVHQRPGRQGGDPHRRAPPARLGHRREALHRRQYGGAHDRRAHPARRRARAGPGREADAFDRGLRGSARAAHGRGAGPRQPPDVQPEQLRRLPALGPAPTAPCSTPSSPGASSRSSRPPRASSRAWSLPRRSSTAATARSRSQAS